MDVYDAARLFDKVYDGFRLDVFSPSDDRTVQVIFAFLRGSNADPVLTTATTELYTGISHQVRPYGYTELLCDHNEKEYTVTIVFNEKKITDVGARTLLGKVVSMAKDITHRYHMI